mmetsp:Transcript_85435/g.198616  ORF Transcript_85435/g.198616 Transcript_85435/m.198616 type:complete len:228 (+) Transcript_85435:168-851(+)
MVVRARPSPPQHIVQQPPALCTLTSSPLVKASSELGSMRCVFPSKSCLITVPPPLMKTIPSPSIFWKQSPAPKQHCAQSARTTSTRVPRAPNMNEPFMVKMTLSFISFKFTATMCPGVSLPKATVLASFASLVKKAMDILSPEHDRAQLSLLFVQHPGSSTRAPSSNLLSNLIPSCIKHIAPGSPIIVCAGAICISTSGMESPVKLWLLASCDEMRSVPIPGASTSW